ncbi:MAG: arginase family protein [Bacillota bacterium]
MRISVLAQPYNVQGKGCGGGAGPAALLRAGLVDGLRAQGHEVCGSVAVELAEAEERRYGGWNRVGTANGRLADLVAPARDDGNFILTLGADCNSVLGVLGGLSRSAEPAWPRRVGLVWIDAHADYNTPETSPSGMLGGMPVAVACGRCLGDLRRRSGLRVPLLSPDVVMIGQRDLDPPEREAIAAEGVVTVALEEWLSGSDRLRWALEHLGEREEVIDVHVDLDILDPERAPAAGLPAPGGISGEQLGAGLRSLLSHPKVGALTFVSYGADRDTDGRTLREVSTAILESTK